VDGKPVARVGDPLAPHSKPKHPPHPRAIAGGSSTVMIDGMPAAVTGGAVTCGGVTIGSGTVVIGDAHTPAPFSGVSPPLASSAAAGDASGNPSAPTSTKSPQLKQPMLPENLPKPGKTPDRTESSSASNSRDSKDSTKTLRIGVFFDGTGNHMENDLRSTDRDITNVAKLYQLYPDEGVGGRYAKIYIEGPGTADGEVTEKGFIPGETTVGMALGLGDEGGHSRIDKALDDAQVILEDGGYSEVTFDVFGFSRGAALARHFVNLINAQPEKWPALSRVSVGFVGLFDTVGSFYVPGNSENFDFNLHLSAQSADQVVHLTAFHEIRKNFPLTRIEGLGGLPVNFIEKAMPGVHSDVGGGYENPEKDIRNYETFFIRSYQGHGLNSETIRSAQQKISELNQSDSRNIQPRVQGTDVIAEERRATRKELAIVSLHKMYGYAQNSGVPLDDLDRTDKNFQIPEDLKKAIEQWSAAGGRLENSRDFLSRYIHTSHRRGAMAHAPEQSGQRRKFINKAEKSVVPKELLADAH
jgi:uncharacterized protein (DUF2235 family)